MDRCILPNEWEQKFDTTSLAKLVKYQTLMESAIACCGGKAAMDHWYGYKAKDERNWKASDDYRQARSMALELNGTDSEGATLLPAWLEHRAAKLVERHWPKVRLLAATLIERGGKINGNEINALVKGV
jgi:hypothetical protein